MKKTALGGWNVLSYGRRLRAPAQMLRIMRMLSFFLFVALLSTHAEGTAQNVTLSGKRLTLKQVFSAIEQQTGYVMLASEDVFTNRKVISLRVSDMPLPEFLDVVLKDFSLKYAIQDKTIVLSRSYAAKNALSPLPDITGQPDAAIAGRVLGVDRQPLEGASVKVKNKPGGTTTNANGDFSIEASVGDVLVVSYTGYDIKEHKITNVVNIVISLTLEDSQMEEVVVNTGMFRKANASFTGASTTVTAKELAQFGNRNLLTSLRNIDPAFNIIPSNAFGSNPNRMPEIQIRGNSSIPNVGELQDETRISLNTPLFIIDGIESSLEKVYDLNQNDVESVTILKDASATAMYGSRGANGVVVIVSRAPQMGKLKLTLSSNLKLDVADLTDYNLLNARDKLQLEYLAGYYNATIATDDVELKRYYYHLVDEVNRGVNTDWLAIPLRNGVGRDHGLRIEGGDRQFRYSASAQYNATEGAMKGSFRRVFNGSLTLSYTHHKLRIRNNMQIRHTKSGESPYGTFADYARQNPYWTPYDSLGKVAKYLGSPTYANFTPYWIGGLPGNPLYNATLQTFNKTGNTEIFNTSFVDYTFSKSLNLTGRFGITKGFSQTDRFRPADHTAFLSLTGANVFRRGDYLYSVRNKMRYEGGLTLQYNKIIDVKHVIMAGANYRISEDQEASYSFLAEGFPRANLDFMSMGLQYAEGGKPSGAEDLSRSVGAAATVNYVYDGKYFVDGTYTVDGASQFGTNKRFAPFWSVGAGWNLHKEKRFAEHYGHINMFKIRGSVGVTGSQNFAAYQSLSTYQYYISDRYFSWMGSYLMGLGNPDLKWQRQVKYNLGIDLAFFDRRLNVSGDYYIQTTEGLVSTVNLPMSNGFSGYTDNIGSIRNKGFDVKVTGVLVRNKDLLWSVTGSALQNRNKVLATSQALKNAQSGILNGPSSPGTLYIEGYSNEAIWVVPSLGIDPSTGKEVFLAKNGEPTTTWRGTDVAVAGSREPDLRGGISTMFRYKRFSVNTALGYSYGGQQYNETLINKVELTSYRYNVDQRVFHDRWQKPGDVAAFKGILETTPTNKTSRFVQNENFLELQNVSLEYQVTSKAFLEKMRMKAFYITMNISSPLYISTVRRERGTAYPFSRQYSLSFNASF